MSMPNIPNITPKISLTRCETIDLLLSSIAMEEMALSHILNAEGEKLQLLLKKHSGCFEDYWKVNESVNKTLRTIVKSQMLLQFKLEDVMVLNSESDCGNSEDKKEKPCKCNQSNSCDCNKPCKCTPCNDK